MVFFYLIFWQVWPKCLKTISQTLMWHAKQTVHISLPVGTNSKPSAAIGKFPDAIGKLMIGKTLATIGEEMTNAMIGNDILAICW